MIGFLFTEAYPPSDQEFMLQLFQEYGRLMFSIAQRYIPDGTVWEDIVQDCLEKLIKRVSVLRPMKRRVLVQYIVSTTKNTSINFLRRQDVCSRQVVSIESSEVADLPADIPSLDETIILEEQRASLLEIWPLLSQEDQILLEGKYLLGESDQALAKQLGCKPDSVRMKLTRARRKALRFLIERDGDHHDKA